MSNFTVDECMTPDCGSTLPGEPGIFYCDECVAEQTAEAQAEAGAFDAYHAWADSIARRKDEQ